jgi:O-succinylbenzoate synthase
MRIDALELRIVALPLISPFVAAHGTTTTRTAVIVRISGPDGEGWGECAALPEPTYSAEYVDGAFTVLRDELGPRLLATGPITAAQLRQLLPSEHPMARAALELALIDAECGINGRSLAERFCDTPRTVVPAGVAIGLLPSPAATATEAVARIGEGYRRLKLKIEPGHDIEVVRAVREAIGPEIALMVDANGSYRPADTELLAQLDPFGLTCLEQPLAVEDLEGHAELARRITTPICLDESLISAERTEAAISMGACSVVCVKAPRMGSWLDAVEVLDLCHRHDVDAWIGGMLDTGIGRLANIALAAHPAATLTGDISATGRFFTEDICPPVNLRGPAGAGVIDVPTSIGFAAALDRVALERLTIRTETLRN